MVRGLIEKVTEAVSGMIGKKASEEISFLQDSHEIMANIGAMIYGDKEAASIDAGSEDSANAAVTSHELLKLFEKVLPDEVIDEMAGQEGVNAIVTGAHDKLRGIMVNRIKEAFTDKVQDEYGFYDYILNRVGGGNKGTSKKEVTRIQSQKDIALDTPEGQKELIKEFSEKGLETLNKPGVEFKASSGGKTRSGERVKGLTKKRVNSIGVSVPNTGALIGEAENKKEEYEIVKRSGKIFDPSEVKFSISGSSGDLEDVIDQQIGKMFDYYRTNPDRFIKMLVKVKGGLKEKGGIKGGRKSLEEASPVASVYLYPKTNKKLEEQAIGDNKTVEDTSLSDRGRRSMVDVGVLSTFRSLLGKDIPWYMTSKGIKKGDKIGIKIRFKGIPELTEEYAVEIPSSVGDIKDRGEAEPYHFRVLDVGEDGVLLQFVEQSKERGEDWVERLRESGMTEEELSTTIGDMATYYTDNVFRKMDAPDMIAELGGEVAVAGEKASPGTLGQAIAALTERAEGVGQKDEEGVLPGYKQKKQEEIEKGERALGDTQEDKALGELISKSDYMSKIRPLIETIASKFPEKAVFHPENIKTVGLEAALTTKSMVKWLLTIMADEALDLSKSGTVPWKELVRDVIQDRSDMLLDPAEMAKNFSASHLGDLFRALKIVAAKDAGVPTEEVLQMVDLYQQGKLPLTPEDRQKVLGYMRKVTGTDWRKSSIFSRLGELQQSLQTAILELAKTDPDVARLMQQSRLRGEIQRGTGEKYDEVKNFYDSKEKELISALKSANGPRIIKILGRDLYESLVEKRLLPDVEDEAELQSYEDFDAADVKKLIDDVIPEYRKAVVDPAHEKYKAQTYPQIQKRMQEKDKEAPEFSRQKMLREASMKIYHDMMRDFISQGSGMDRDLNEMAVGLVSRR